MKAQASATRLVLYARKSNDREDRQVRSLGDQLKLAREEAAKLGIPIVHEIIESKSAKRPGKRPGFQEMIELIEAGKADGILCWHPDRLARNSVDGGWVVDLLDRKLAKNLHFLSYYFDNSPEGKMALGMVFSQAKYQVDKLLKRAAGAAASDVSARARTHDAYICISVRFSLSLWLCCVLV